MTNQEYRALEDAFLARHDALCEEKNPLECDCPACPCKGINRKSRRFRSTKCYKTN